MTEQIQHKYASALDVAHIVCDAIKEQCVDIEICGGLRRKKDYVHDIDIVIQLADETAFFWLNTVLGSRFANIHNTEKKIELKLLCDLQPIKIEITPTESAQQFEVMKMIRTGSAEFNRQLVSKAHELGMALRFSGDDYGLFGAKRTMIKQTGVYEWIINPMRVEGRTEKEIIMKVFGDSDLLEPENRNWESQQYQMDEQ